jgi:biopolymer transport protein ExbB/TolQ
MLNCPLLVIHFFPSILLAPAASFKTFVGHGFRMVDWIYDLALGLAVAGAESALWYFWDKRAYGRSIESYERSLQDSSDMTIGDIEKARKKLEDMPARGFYSWRAKRRARSTLHAAMEQKLVDSIVFEQVNASSNQQRQRRLFPRHRAAP